MGFSCSTARGVFLDEGLSLCPLRWQQILIHCSPREVPPRETLVSCIYLHSSLDDLSFPLSHMRFLGLCLKFTGLHVVTVV